MPAQARNKRGHAALPRFEPLEARTVCSASPTPGDGHDYIFLEAGQDDPVATVQPKAVPAQVTAPSDAFKWLDGTRPLSVAGRDTAAVKTIFVDSWSFWPRNAQHEITTKDHADEANARALAREVVGISDSLVIDIEDWPVDIRYDGRAAVDNSIVKFRQVLGWIRDEEPTLKLGVYDMFPLADQYRSTYMGEPQELGRLDPSSWYAGALPMLMQGYAQWQAANEYLRPIAQDVDFICPSLYTRTTDIDGQWTQFANSMIDDARRFGKPVIPFVYTGYHDVVPVVGHTPLPLTDWQHELDVIRATADGMIVWQGDDYDPNAAWVNVYIAAADRDLPVSTPAPAFAPTAAPLALLGSTDQNKGDDTVSSLLDLAA